MAYTPVRRVAVYAWGRLVGAVGPAAGSRAYEFQYDADWVRTGLELAPTLMPLRSARRLFSFPELPERTFYRLPPMLADALPDAFGNAIVDAALAREGVSRQDVSPLDRLAYTGARAMGALTFVPDTSPLESTSMLEIAGLVEAARAAVQGTLNDQDDRSGAVARLLAVGTSAGGARAKAVIAWNRTTGELMAGNLPDTPPGFEQWLLKFDGIGPDHDLGTAQEFTRTEYAYSLMARAAGVEMAPCELLHEGGRAHFVTRRFDRPGVDGDRLHMQTLCGVSGADFNATGVHDYATYFATMRDLGIDDVEQAFRRVVFNVLAANNDDHTKNLAFLMDEQGVWRLAPAYDLTFAYNPKGEWTFQHQMSVEGEFRHITAELLYRLGDRVGVPGYRAVVADVAAAVAEWPAFAAEAGLGQARIAEVAGALGFH